MKTAKKMMFTVFMSTMLFMLPASTAFAKPLPAKDASESTLDATPRANLDVTYRAWDADHMMEVIVKYTVSDGTNTIAGVQDCYITSRMSTLEDWGYPSYTISKDKKYITVTCKYKHYGMRKTAVWTIVPYQTS